MDNSAMKRKRQLPEFRELFKALFNIPDKDIHIRVLDAINGIVKETCDCLCCKKDVTEKGTQTDFHRGSPISVEAVIRVENPIKNQVNGLRPASPVAMKRSFSVDVDSNGGREIKRRKRNRKVPRVEKSTNEPEPFLAKPMPSPNQPPSPCQPPSEVSSDPLGIRQWNLDDMGTISDLQHPVISKQELIERMRAEWNSSGVYNPDGLLPVHKAIKENNLNLLKRQLWVLAQKKLNINDIFTQDEETLIQFSIRVDSSTKVVEELLDRDIKLDDLDEKGNSIFHLAMQHTKNINILNHLLDRFTLDLDFLLKTNDSGLTALHIGVKEENLLMCKALLDFVDKKLNLSTVGKDEVMVEELKKIYLDELNSFGTRNPVRLNKTKMKLINAIDVMHGRTPLFHAVTGNSNMMVYMLLCHLANPLISERSGMDCLAYVENVDNIDPHIQNALRYAANYLEKCI